MIDHAVNARGYTMLFAVSFTMLAIVPRMAGTQRWTWLALAPLLAIGFYIVPVMMYPAAIIGIWLLFSGLFDVEKARRLRYFIKLAIVFVAGAVLTVALYSPVMVTGDFMGHVQRQMEFGAHAAPTSQIADLQWRIEEFWTISSFGWPTVLAWLVAAGLVLSVVFGRKAGPYGNRLLYSVILGTGAAIFITKVTPPFWTLGFMLPFVAGPFGRRLGRRLDMAPAVRASEATRRRRHGGVHPAGAGSRCERRDRDPARPHAVAGGLRGCQGCRRRARRPAPGGGQGRCGPVYAPARCGTTSSGPGYPTPSRSRSRTRRRCRTTCTSWMWGRATSEQVEAAYYARGFTNTRIVKVLPNSRIVQFSKPREE